MRMHSVTVLAIAALTLSVAACEPSSPATADAAAASAANDDSAAPVATPQAQAEWAFLGKVAPPYPEGFAEEGGHIEEASGSEVHVIYGRWTHAGEAQTVMFVERPTGAEHAQGRPPAEIVSVYATPAPRPGEIIFTEYCTHPDYSETAARIYATASTGRGRPGLSDPPSAAWRLDRATGRLAPVDAARATCAFDHME